MPNWLRWVIGQSSNANSPHGRQVLKILMGNQLTDYHQGDAGTGICCSQRQSSICLH